MDLVTRYKQIREWLFDMSPPSVLRLGKLFNPTAFLTGLLMEGARRNDEPLDQMVLARFCTLHSVILSCKPST